MSTSDSIAPIGQPIRAPKTAELIATQLRRQIVRGELPPGETLPPELQLMTQFGVSRPTLREAFRILESETLITVRRGSRGGAQVTTPDTAVAARNVGLLLQLRNTAIKDVYEARMVIEPSCARLLARRRTSGDLAAIRAIITELSTVVAAGPAKIPDAARWSDLTYAFHEAIFERCGNNTLTLQCELLADIVATHLRRSITQGLTESESPAQLRRTLRSFTKMADLVEAKDGDGAERHWRAHLEAAGRLIFAAGQMEGTVVDLFT